MSGASVKIPTAPPSDGRVDLWSRCATREAGAEFREALLEALREHPLPPRVTATATISFADRRSREAHNFRLVLRRAVADALGDQGELVDFAVRLRKGARRPATSIELTEATS